MSVNDNRERRRTFLVRFTGALQGMIDSARTEGREEEAELLQRLDRPVLRTLADLMTSLPSEPRPVESPADLAREDALLAYRERRYEQIRARARKLIEGTHAAERHDANVFPPQAPGISIRDFGLAALSLVGECENLRDTFRFVFDLCDDEDADPQQTVLQVRETTKWEMM
jgi:hypothetical protein